MLHCIFSHCKVKVSLASITILSQKRRGKNPRTQRIQVSQPELLPKVWAAYKGSSYKETKMHWGLLFTSVIHHLEEHCRTVSQESFVYLLTRRTHSSRSQSRVSLRQFILLKKHQLNWKEEFTLTCSEETLDFLLLVSGTVIPDMV